MVGTQDGTTIEELTKKAENQAAENIGSYKRKLFFYAILGYIVIFGALLLLLVILGGLGFASFQSTTALIVLLKSKIIFIFIPIIWILLKALWIKIDAPEGYELTRKDYPELFSSIDNISKKLSAPKVHNVILTDELNAAVVQTPRLGIFGWNKNTVILGLELLLVASPKEAEAVLSHELGHLSGSHSSFNCWIYRVRMSWNRIMDAFDRSSGMGPKLMQKFFDWYSPRFAAYSFALARINEYEADSMAAEVTSNADMGNALVNVYATGPYVDKNYWNVFFKSADTQPSPKYMPWNGLSDFLNSHDVAKQELNNYLETVLKDTTSYHDTHPCLTDRLNSLGQEALLPEVPERNAAEVWLGGKYNDVIKHFDKEWLDKYEISWKERYEYATSSKDKLKELSKFKADDLSDEQLWDKARLEEEFGNPEIALAAYRIYQSREPNDFSVAFCIGRLLYDKDDEEILTQMKTALSSKDLIVRASEYAYYYLVNKDRKDEAQWWQEQASKQIDYDNAASKEREMLSPDDNIVSYEASEELKQYLIEKLKESGKVKKAWLAQKTLNYYSDNPALAIAIVDKGFSLSEDSASDKISSYIELDCTFFVVPKTGEYKKLAKKIIKIGERIL